jgi:glycosyltransferase involved in cell wall biosynthesis
MRLLVFTESYVRGGGNRYMIDLANAIANDFEQVTFTSNPGGIFREDLMRFAKPADVLSIPLVTRNRVATGSGRLPFGLGRALSFALLLFEPLFLILNVLMLWRLFARLRPDTILSCNGGYPASPACLAAVIAARLHGVPAVLSIVSMPSRRRPYFWIYDALLDAIVWRASRLVVINAHIIGSALKSMRGLPDDKAVVLHNGIDDASPALTAKLEDTLTVGCVARLDAMKGVLVLLDAFTEIAAERSDLRLVLAGEGDASAEVAKRVRARGLGARVSLLGHFSGNIDELLRSFDIFAFPSLWEGFPYSIVEAMRAERAIVATRVGGIPEAISDEKEGLLVAPADSAALAQALRRFIGDPGLRQTCANGARARFVKEFSLHEMHRRAHAAIIGGA